MRIKLFEYKDLNIVEFVSGEDNGQCPLCSESSRYIHGSVFSVFQNAFVLSSSDYSYFEKNSFRGSSTISLRNHLQDFVSRVQGVRDAEDLEILILKQPEGIDFMNELKTFYPDWRIRWERFKNELKVVLSDIIDLVDECIDEEKIFWVKGY